MTSSLARRERSELCDLALALGPDAPTLCEGWDAHDLVSHLLIRERRPIAAMGNVVGPMSGLTDRAMARHKAQSYEVLVERLRRPAPLLRAVPAVDRMMNTFELVVHHEDLRRAQDDWQPRELAPEDLDLIWSQLAKGAVFFGRRIPVPTIVKRSDTGATAVVRKGDDPVTVTGPVVDLVLLLFGRSAVLGLEYDGPADKVAELRASDLGV